MNPWREVQNGCEIGFFKPVIKLIQIFLPVVDIIQYVVIILYIIM